jgi:hypothetical protein
LHVVTDWPGFFPNGPAIVTQLIAAGADPNAPVEGSWHAETALHWAASSDDVEVARALIDAGADIEAPGASIAGGAPLDAAIGYGCWRVARLLVERGARVGKLWQAAALAMTSRVEELLSSAPATRQDLTDVLASVSRRSPPDRGAPPLSWGGLNGTPSWDETTPLDAADSIDTGTQALVDWLREQGARSLKQTS